MQRTVQRIIRMSVLVFSVAVAIGAPTEKTLLSAPAQRPLSIIRQEIASVMQERDAALQQLNARYASAALADRVALEAEGARLEEQFERHYLQLLIEYHQQSGNVEELARAERMLKAMDSWNATGTPLNLDRNLTPPTSSVDKPQEGGIINAR